MAWRPLSLLLGLRTLAPNQALKVDGDDEDANQSDARAGQLHVREALPQEKASKHTRKHGRKKCEGRQLCEVPPIRVQKEEAVTSRTSEERDVSQEQKVRRRQRGKPCGEIRLTKQRRNKKGNAPNLAENRTRPA